MSMLETGLVGLLIVIAISLVAIVLVQRGKGADIGAAFGSGASNTVFGSAGSLSFLTKTTAWLAFAFFLISFGLAYTARERAESAGEVGIPQVTEMVYAKKPRLASNRYAKKPRRRSHRSRLISLNGCSASQSRRPPLSWLLSHSF